MKFYTYIIYSLIKNKYYIGFTEDLLKLIKEPLLFITSYIYKIFSCIRFYCTHLFYTFVSNMISIIENNLPSIIELCKKHHVKTLALFGSGAKDNLNSTSDIDFLVTFSNNIDVLDYADNYFIFLESLEKITGKSVDLVSSKSLKNRILIEEINNTKIDLYAA